MARGRNLLMGCGCIFHQVKNPKQTCVTAQTKASAMAVPVPDLNPTENKWEHRAVNLKDLERFCM